MNAASQERVLCARTSDIPTAWLPECGSVRLEESEFVSALGGIQAHWIARADAENDPSYKQWIPYLLLRNPEGSLAAYARQGGETRLHGTWSLGLGGHINPVDASRPDGHACESWRDWIRSELRRELAEEFPGATDGQTRFLGLVHENTSVVGRVHLGIAFLHDAAGIHGEPGAELASFRWLVPSDIGTASWPLERFESWSQLSLGLLQDSPWA